MGLRRGPSDSAPSGYRAAFTISLAVTESGVPPGVLAKCQAIVGLGEALIGGISVSASASGGVSAVLEGNVGVGVSYRPFTLVSGAAKLVNALASLDRIHREKAIDNSHELCKAWRAMPPLELEELEIEEAQAEDSEGGSPGTCESWEYEIVEDTSGEQDDDEHDIVVWGNPLKVVRKCVSYL